jgi:hypothetical protein
LTFLKRNLLNYRSRLTRKEIRLGRTPSIFFLGNRFIGLYLSRNPQEFFLPG